MRLIDADALLIRMKKDALYYLVERYGMSEVIEEEPTVDAIPIKHGRWLHIENYMGDEARCSECGRSICVNEPGNGLPNMGDLKYCQFCGARMERKEE